MPSGTIAATVTKECKECGELFTKANGRSKYCSVKCRTRANNRAGEESRRRRGIDSNATAKERAGRYEEGKIQCVICGKWYVQVCSHVLYAHNLSNREYKKILGVDAKKGVVPDWYHKKKRKLNYETKDIAWKNFEKGKRYWFRKGVSTYYKRSQETIDRLRKQGRWLARNFGLQQKSEKESLFQRILGGIKKAIKGLISQK